MYSAALLSLAALAAAAPAPSSSEANIVSLPARRSLTHPDGTVNVDALMAHLDNTLVKYNYHAHAKSPLFEAIRKTGHLERRATGTVALTDEFANGTDELYYGPATVGKQTGFTVDFDTGSADFFVPGPNCGTAQGCTGNVKYNQGGKSEGNSTAIIYGSGQVSGNNYLDTVTVGGLSADNVNVISLNQAMGFAGSGSNSLMGMGFSTIANSKQPTFFEKLMAAKTVTANEFSFFLGRGVSGTQAASELFLGGRNPAKFTGAVSKIPVTRKGYWQVALDSVYVNNKKIGLTQGQAAIDTGTTIVLAPSVAAQSIFSNIPGAIPIPIPQGTISLYAYQCNRVPNVAITFGGKQFAINPKDFSIGRLDAAGAGALGIAGLFGALSGPLCVAAIGAADLDPTQNLFVVGDSFLKNWYSIYNYDGAASVSFAAAKGNQ